MDTDELMSAVPVPLGEPTAPQLEVDATDLGSPQHHDDGEPVPSGADVHAQLSDVEDPEDVDVDGDDQTGGDALQVENDMVDADSSTTSTSKLEVDPAMADPGIVNPALVNPEGGSAQSAADVPDVDMVDAVDDDSHATNFTDDVVGVDSRASDPEVGVVGNPEVGVGNPEVVGVGESEINVGDDEGEVELEVDDTEDDDYDEDEETLAQDGGVLGASATVEDASSHAQDSGSHAGVDTATAATNAVLQDPQPIETSVEVGANTESIEVQHHSGSATGSGSGTLDGDDGHGGHHSAVRSSAGRLRVNDKGEPTMMLPSFIWDYFVKEANGKFVVCTLCPTNVTRFAYSGGTSTMNRHLRKKHQKYAPGKSAADYARPRAAKRALAAALASGSNHTASMAAAPPTTSRAVSSGSGGGGLVTSGLISTTPGGGAASVSSAVGVPTATSSSVAAAAAAAAAAIAASVNAMASSPVSSSSATSSSHPSLLHQHHHSQLHHHQQQSLLHQQHNPHLQQHQHQHQLQGHDGSTGAGPSTSPAAMPLGSLSPSETTRRQLIELRNARRRATTAKRRKLIHGMLDTDQYAIAAAVGTTTCTTTTSATTSTMSGTSTTGPLPLAASTPTHTGVVPQAEFDPSGFVTLHTPGGTVGGVVSTGGGGLQFPPGFELSDTSALDVASSVVSGAGGDVRLYDYTPTTLLSTAMANSLLANGGVNTAAGMLTPLYAAPRHLSSRRNPQQHKLLTHRLLKYLIAQYEPLDVSRMGAELGALVSGTDYPNHAPPNTTFLPSEETLKLALANLYYSQREMLKEVIAEVDVLSLSLNNWKSVFGQNVLTVSGHWISQGFSRRDCVLEVYVLPLDESVNTIALLRDVMDKWEIPANKVAALTMLKNGTDDKAIHEEYPGLTVVNCFVNVLDNAVSAGLMKCAPLIRRCRNYVSYFIQNPSEYQIFLSLQRKVAEANFGIHSDDASRDMGAGGEEEQDEDEEEGGEEDDGGEGKATSDSPKLSPHSGGGSQHHSNGGSSGNGSGNGSGSGSGNGSGTRGGGTSIPMHLPALSVICDFEDRWNSTSEMICRIVELEHMLMLYKSNLESDTNPNRRPMQLRFVCCELSADEWANLKELARLLEPIEGVVHVATNCEYPGLSITLPLLHSIRKHLDAAELWIATSLASAVRNSIASALASALPLCACGAMPPASPYLSCLLDPRFKALPFLDPRERDQLIEMLKMLHVELVDGAAGAGDKDHGDHHHHYHHHHHHHHSHHHQDKKAKIAAALGLGSTTGGGGGGGSSVSVVGGAKKGGILNTFFPVADTHAHDPASELLEKFKAHVQLYLDSPSLPATDDRENDPLDWWSRYVRSFPWLAKLAKKYLCMSAVSVPFYEAFTNYGQLMREKKARLDIEVAAQILFCRSVSRIPEMERMNV